MASEKVLGMWWSTSSDTFSYSPMNHKKISQLIKEEYHPTKRQVLQTLMTVFDPIGLLGHFMIYVKILFQNIWKLKLAWDETINDTQYN